VGLTFNLRRTEAASLAGDDREAEYDPPTTVAAIHDAIESHGHTVIDLEATSDLPLLLAEAKRRGEAPDVVFNVAEGLEGRAREAQVPALLELLGIPYSGSDPAALAVAHDKSLAKRIVAHVGLPTPAFMVMNNARQRLDPTLTFPLVAKPLAEGSSKGVTAASVSENETDLRAFVGELVERYHQPVLIEQFLPGREFTLAILGQKPRVLCPLEVVFKDKTDKLPVYSFASKFIEPDRVGLSVPAKVDDPLREELSRVALGAFHALGCRDFARVDLRIDAQGRVSFIECNPLPGLTPAFSDMCLIAAAEGIEYPALIGEILAPALKRLRDRERQREIDERF
jgi:D-alanine-D-alanine ligase